MCTNLYVLKEGKLILVEKEASEEELITYFQQKSPSVLTS